MEKWTLPRREYLGILVALSAATLAAGRVTYHLIRNARSSHSFVYKAPRSLGQKRLGGSPSEPYPTNALPGARDVDTPYGSVRVNEWGPSTGRKVLFVHGVSTPSTTFTRMATKLVEEDGCRVMTFDLFGRGYSDTPDPSIIKHDSRLFTTQIMLVLASSTQSWTGTGNEFTLVGYSLGGGIAMAFASYFPQMIDNLVLIAPSGLMPTNTIRLSSRIIYGDWLPRSFRDYLVRRRIVDLVPHRRPTVARKVAETIPATVLPGSAPPSNDPDSSAFALPSNDNSLIPGYPASAQDTVVWQIDAHPGFLRAFISSIQNAPIGDQHDNWRALAMHLSRQNEDKLPGLRPGKVLLLLGKDDSVVVADDTAADAVELLGKENVQVKVLPGGHEVPITHVQTCVQVMRNFWATADTL